MLSWGGLQLLEPFARVAPQTSFACLSRIAGLKGRSKSIAAEPVRNPLEQYDHYVSIGRIRGDEHQRKMLAGLNRVHVELSDYVPVSPVGSGSVSGVGSFFGLFRTVKKPEGEKKYGPKGIYLYGDVGCGKTMLMDMFYTTVPAHLAKKRIHFHGFMQEYHKRAHTLKEKHGMAYDVADAIALEVAATANIICLDEMQVTDVGDAMVMRRLFQKLYDYGVVTFYTSNRHPTDLYKHGVQRESFIPCIALIEERNDVVFLDSPTDYRKLPRPASGCYRFYDETKSPTENAELDKIHAEKWFRYFGGGDIPTTNRALEIWGRPVLIPESAGNRVMKFSFMELCGTQRSAADYLEMCETFPAAVITDIPEMSLEQGDLVRRFITFLDAAYDSHTKLAACARKPFEKLFNTRHLTIDPETNAVVLVGDGNSGDIADISNFSGHEEMFAFARALSRLKHMSSEDWLAFKRE